ncbi:CPBP family intramembrane glutamic endopeptidase [Streptomyces poriticola]|uniref:CPBP family intramembrane glutamic endopeptidase n=1 Tax=Streptomyces poriticola TaxID=3120506 RepID=UPI002FCE01E8
MNRLLLVAAVAPAFALLLGTVIAVAVRFRLGGAGGRRAVERLAPVLYTGTVCAAALLAAALTGFDPVRLGLTAGSDPPGPDGWTVAAATVAGVLAGALGYFAELLLAHRSTAGPHRSRRAPSTTTPADEGPPGPDTGTGRRAVVGAQGDGSGVVGGGGDGLRAVGARGDGPGGGARGADAGQAGAARAGGARAEEARGIGTRAGRPRAPGTRAHGAGAIGTRSVGAWAGTPRVLLALGLLTGVGEEVLFRGYLLAGLQGSLPLWGALVLQAALFGVHHASFGLRAVPAKAVHGLLWGALTLASGSLLPAVAAHVVFQFLVCRRLTRGTRTVRPTHTTQEGGSPDDRDRDGDRAHGSVAVRRPPMAR